MWHCPAAAQGWACPLCLLHFAGIVYVLHAGYYAVSIEPRSGLSFVLFGQNLLVSLHVFVSEACWAAACKSHYGRLLVRVLQPSLLLTAMQTASRFLSRAIKPSGFGCAAGNRCAVPKGSFPLRCIGNRTWRSVSSPVMWKGSALCEVAQQLQILQLVTLGKIDP